MWPDGRWPTAFAEGEKNSTLQHLPEVSQVSIIRSSNIPELDIF